jgi:deoxyribose-phosphate aldolase
MKPTDLRKYIEHTHLKPDSGLSIIKKLASEAIENSFFGICVNSCHIVDAKKFLQGSSVKLVSVVGFPLGACDTMAKAFEADVAVKNGADEIDMVLNIGALKDQRFDFVLKDISEVVKASSKKPVKVIIETGLLTDAEKTKACKIILDSGAQFVKTCTGFNPGSATVADVLLMKTAVNGKLAIKASGGIKSFSLAMDLINAGATRLGTSSGVALVSGEQASSGY